MKTKALFITFEGVDGSGKSTQLQLLKDSLEVAGQAVLTVREPGGTAAGEAIRQILLDPAQVGLEPVAELMLFAAARAQLTAEVIRPALQAKTIVLCDRFIDSTVAYQGYGRGLDTGRLNRLNEWATGGLTPDLTFLLDLDPTRGQERIRTGRKAAKDRMEEAESSFFDRVAKGYRELARKAPQRFCVLDAGQTVATIEEQIKNRVREELEK